MDAGPTLFFISFILIVPFTLLPVVIAVLLDHFTTATRREKDKNERKQLESKNAEGVTSSIDPLLATLMTCRSSEELTRRASDLFDRMDVDRSGALSWQEMSEGLRKMNVKPKINFTEDEFNTITLQQTLCNDEGELDKHAFDRLLRIQLFAYAERNLANSIPSIVKDDLHMGIMTFAIKIILGQTWETNSTFKSTQMASKVANSKKVFRSSSLPNVLDVKPSSSQDFKSSSSSNDVRRSP